MQKPIDIKKFMKLFIHVGVDVQL